jgi:hypothetical protein
MGNRITNRKNYSQEDCLGKSLKMSNGLTSVFIAILSLSASRLAKTDRDVDFAMWLASCDQSIIGLGAVGFDISEMPWSTENFETEKRFTLSVIDSAKSKQYWNVLDYQPREDWALHSLEQFRCLIEDFTAEFVKDADKKDRSVYKSDKIEKCPIHEIYFHWSGCVICNDK